MNVLKDMLVGSFGGVLASYSDSNPKPSAISEHSLEEYPGNKTDTKTSPRPNQNSWVWTCIALSLFGKCIASITLGST